MGAQWFQNMWGTWLNTIGIGWIGLMYLQWKRHNCHHPRCHRVGRINHPDGKVYCSKHRDLY